MPECLAPIFDGVPSYDSTGKRLSGGAQRRRAQERAAQRGGVAAELPDTDADEPNPIPFGPPPTDGVEAGIEWIACLQAQVAVLASARRDPKRVRALGVCVKAVSTARSAAADSERAVRLAEAYLALQIDATAEAPPIEPAGLVLWAFWRLLHLAYSTATQEGEVDEAHVAHHARALALLAAVQPQCSIDRLAAAAEAAAEAATVPTLRAVG